MKTRANSGRPPVFSGKPCAEGYRDDRAPDCEVWHLSSGIGGIRIYQWPYDVGVRKLGWHAELSQHMHDGGASMHFEVKTNAQRCETAQEAAESIESALRKLRDAVDAFLASDDSPAPTGGRGNTQ